MFPIDVVIPFVDSSDPIWQEEFKRRGGEFTGTWEGGVSRYRDTGTFKLVLEGLKVCAPWVNKIYLIVSHPSQVPDYAKDCEIILHEDFIPHEFAPVFSSSALEHWMGNLNVGEYFIYMNDDMIPTTPWRTSDFFTLEGIPKTRVDIILYDPENRNVGGHIYENSYELITGIKGSGHEVRSHHGPKPYRLSWCKECLETYYTEFYNKTSPMKREDTDYSQYTYMFYQMLHKEIKQYSGFSGKTFSDGRFPSKFYPESAEDYKWVCINDSEEFDISEMVSALSDHLHHFWKTFKTYRQL